MLTQFNFKNFKAYKNLTTLEMQAEKDDDFSETLLEVDGSKEKFLPVSVLYGPNGGGKTTVLEALICLITHVTSPINLLKYNKQMLKISATPFEFSKNNIVEFEIFFIENNYEYKYIMKIEEENILKEELYRTQLMAKKPEMIFIRELDEITLGANLKKNKVNTVVNSQLPYLSFLSISYNIDIIEDAILFFKNARFINVDLSEKIPQKLLEMEEYKRVFLEILNSIDSCIVDFIIEKEENDNSYKVFTIHEVGGKKYKLNLSKESKGTIKIFSILPSILSALLNGGLCIIDELDSKLHPKLLRYIIELFKEKNINSSNAQLIFTSHDLATMNHDVFRRDEILFAAKNEKEESELYSLSEIRDENGKSVNKNSSYSKQYLEGRYGSDPYMKRMQELSSEE